MKKIFLFGLIISIICISGCVQSDSCSTMSKDSCIQDEDCIYSTDPCFFGNKEYFNKCVNVSTEIRERCTMPFGEAKCVNNKCDWLSQQIIGGTRDEHGCLGPAGYSYNETLNVCIREWEFAHEDIRSAIRLAVEYIKNDTGNNAGYVWGLTLVNVSVPTCMGCEGDYFIEFDFYQKTIGIKINNWEVDVNSLPREDYCNTTDTGWICVPFKFKQECEDTGGRSVCYGWCEASYSKYCDFPYDDAGKDCTNSKQCEGNCTISREYIKENYPDKEWSGEISCPDCIGECAEYPLRECDWWYELNNGVIKGYGALCD